MIMPMVSRFEATLKLTKLENSFNDNPLSIYTLPVSSIRVPLSAFCICRCVIANDQML